MHCFYTSGLFIMKRLLVMIYFFIFFQIFNPLLEARVSMFTKAVALTSGLSSCATVALLYRLYVHNFSLSKQEQSVEGFVRHVRALMTNLATIAGFSQLPLAEQVLLRKEQQIIRVAGGVSVGLLMIAIALMMKNSLSPESSTDVSVLCSKESQAPFGLYGRDYESPKKLFEKYQKPMTTVEDFEYNAALHLKALDFICVEKYKEYKRLFDEELKKQNNLSVRVYMEKVLGQKANAMITYIDGMRDPYFKDYVSDPLRYSRAVPLVDGGRCDLGDRIQSASKEIRGEKVILKHFTQNEYEQAYEQLTMRCAMQAGLHFSSENKQRKAEIKRQLDWEIEQRKSGEFLLYGIFDPNTGACMGSVNVRKSDGEIGYWIGEAYRGNGRMEEAVKLITVEYFKCTKVPYILAEVNPENIASLKLLLKTGFRIIGKTNEKSCPYDVLKLDNPLVV